MESQVQKLKYLYGLEGELTAQLGKLVLECLEEIFKHSEKSPTAYIKDHIAHFDEYGWIANLKYLKKKFEYKEKDE